MITSPIQRRCDINKRRTAQEWLCLIEQCQASSLTQNASVSTLYAKRKPTGTKHYFDSIDMLQLKKLTEKSELSRPFDPVALSDLYR
ncbi:hypothetical protein LDJ79_16730 [Vibrio tritonius]|uniref:Uncharacterized protein n=1 Tax=Vibrio tritonius TaxID=1435069 RepID=A0ABS7YQ22_9VIBR|nr:hypothetical protein [Vibrio tritonius]MCA2017768.1 hypothetical protein [Vibrio tritonius]